MPAVSAAEGDVWIASWTAPLPPATRAPRVPSGFVIPLNLQLGAIALSPQHLKRLRGGDIVLLATPALRAWRGGFPLFDFHLQTESVLVTDVHSPLSPDLPRADARLPSDDHLLDLRGLEDLPLELHVLLCRIDLSLGELAGLQAGSVVTLPEKAIERVQLLHNGRPLVTGELVQVGDRLGVKLAQAPRLT